MIGNALPRHRIAPVDRSDDRTVALLAIAGAVAFLVLALASLALPAADRRGLWLPLHLVLAGSATSAIVGVMPFFVAAFAASAPVGVRLRLASLGAVVAGALLVSSGVVLGPPWTAVAGGGLFIAGIVLTGITTVLPIRGALGPSRGIVSRAYLAALVAVAIGATLATLLLAGYGPVAEAWVRLKPAHAWLNLVGFVSLVIAATLLHFFPTVAASRILDGRAGRATVVGIAFGGFVVPIGFAVGSDWIVRLGAASTVVGAIALAVYAAGVWRRRGRWSTDATWHAFVIGGLASAIAWFVAGMGVAGGRLVVLGAVPDAWTLDTVAAPLVIGWVGLAIVASASHLLPAIGPGTQAAHARQRVLLGRLGFPRLVAADLGVLLLALGPHLGSGPVVVAGVAVTVAAFGSTAVLVAAAIGVGLRSRAGGILAP